jgi:hypothetical protein
MPPRLSGGTPAPKGTSKIAERSFPRSACLSRTGPPAQGGFAWVPSPWEGCGSWSPLTTNHK